MPLIRSAWFHASLLSVSLIACTPLDQANVTTSQERLASFRSQLQQNPTNIAALIGVGDEELRRGRWQEAAAAYAEALLIDPQSNRSRTGYTAAQSGLGNWNVAHQSAVIAFSQEPTAINLSILGVTLSGLGQHDEAIAQLEQAVAQEPRNLHARNNLALAMALNGDPAAYTIQRAVAFAPDADDRHVRNFYLIAAMTGFESNARREGSSLNISEDLISEIFQIGRSARQIGPSAFGLAHYR
jgi:tetratricopeptide (TPR) repeat protein